MNNTVTQEQINDTLAHSEFRMGTVFDKVTVLHCRLPNGFVLSAESACVDPANYDPVLGRALCEKKIADKLWELEGYRLACELEPKPIEDESEKGGNLVGLDGNPL